MTHRSFSIAASLMVSAQLLFPSRGFAVETFVYKAC